LRSRVPPAEPLIRPAQAADAGAVADIYNQGIEERTSTFETDHSTAADVEPWLAAGHRLPLLVAELDGAVVGWARLLPYSDRPCYAGVAEISIYVDRAARGHGIGRRLIAALEQAARERDYYKLTGKLFTNNEASAGLLRSCGWRDVGLHRRHGRLDGEWRDVLLVERLL
jgi:phosphinothricin acetyltransferase